MIKQLRLISFLFILMFVGMTSCSQSSSNVKHLSSPPRMAMHTIDEDNAVMVIANTNGTVALVDLASNGALDLDARIKNSQNLFIGGIPTAVATYHDTSAPYLFTLVVATEIVETPCLWFIGVSRDSENRYSFEFIDHGDQSVSDVGAPAFIDKNSASDPKLLNLTLHSPDIGRNVFTLKFKNETTGYSVEQYAGTSTIPTIIPTFAPSTGDYTTPDGSISLTMKEGLNQTSSGDVFYFYTVGGKPLILPARINDMVVTNERAYLLSGNTFTVYDLTLKAVVQEYPLGAEAFKLTSIQRNDQSFIMVTDVQSLDEIPESLTQIYRYTLSSATMETITTDSPINRIAYDTNHDLFYALSRDDHSLALIQPDTKETLKTFSIDETSDLLFLSDAIDPAKITPLLTRSDSARPVLFIGSLLGSLTAFDTATIATDEQLVQVDLFHKVSGKESQSSLPVFHDTDAISDASVKSVSTKDGVTPTENVLIFYEGTLPSSESNTGLLQNLELSDVNAHFTALKIVDANNVNALKADQIVIKTGDLQGRVFDIASVVSDTSLRLTSSDPTAPTMDVADLHYSIQSTENGIVIGSKNGLYGNRALPNKRYTSDSGEYALTITASTLLPLSTGDYFSFDAFNGTDALLIGGHPIAALQYSIQDRSYIAVLSEQDATVYLIDATTLTRSAIIQ